MFAFRSPLPVKKVKNKHFILDVGLLRCACSGNISVSESPAACCYLVELNQGVLEVFEVSLESLRGFLPVLQGAALNITSILQVLQLAFDPRLCLHHKQTKHVLGYACAHHGKPFTFCL